MRKFLWVAAVALMVSPSLAEDWNQWRGPNRNGVIDTVPLIDELPKDGILEPLWVRTRIPPAKSYHRDDPRHRRRSAVCPQKQRPGLLRSARPLQMTCRLGCLTNLGHRSIVASNVRVSDAPSVRQKTYGGLRQRPDHSSPQIQKGWFDRTRILDWPRVRVTIPRTPDDRDQFRDGRRITVSVAMRSHV